MHFVRFIRGLQNFLAIPIMNPLAGFMKPPSGVHDIVFKSLKPYKGLCYNKSLNPYKGIILA